MKNKPYYVYLHYTTDVNEPFYIGAASHKSRPFAMKSRSSAWKEIVTKLDSEVNVKVIEVASKKEATDMETALIKKYEHCVCNVCKNTTLQNTELLLPRLSKPLRFLGENIKLARLRRRVTTTQLAQRANMSRSTYWAIENGDPTVTIGMYINILFVLGLEAELGNVGAHDIVGRKIQDAELLSTRVR